MLLRNHTAHPWPCRQSCHPTGLGDTGRTSPSQRYRPALDGGRVNEAFGDIVNWDLLPQAAIADLTLMPGSNPLYGLNTLGAAIVLRTKSGTTHPGATIEAYGGSFGRISLNPAVTPLPVAPTGASVVGWRVQSDR
jgi:hypothetical protein